MSAHPTRSGEPCGPLKAVKFLIPVWGELYVSQFMKVALPTWLAPGNIPAVAAAQDAEIVFLTNYEGEATIRAHPAFDELSARIRVRMHNIDHLIIATNHSTTITLAYEEAVRAEGEAALDTCFFFLVSDFIVADGSFRNAFRRIEEGYDGVLAGNFQVVAEDASAWLEAKLEDSPTALSLPPRELMSWGLHHLHPATIANTVNFRHSHNAHSNRLFWRVDADTLLGRFFLMHMLCIRPEVTNFSISSSCDYSFIPELCPSDNVAIVSDSDEYLVIEMQPQRHELGSMRLGPRDPIQFAETLSEWTTARHRKNARTSLVFHAADVSPEFSAVEAEADVYLASVAQHLTPEPQPHRDHPYWTGAIAAWREAVGKPLSDFEWRIVLGYTSPLAKKERTSERLKGLGIRLLGRPPFVRAWHPRWPDYQLVLDHLKSDSGGALQRQIRISDAPTVFTATVDDQGQSIYRIRKSAFLQRWPEYYTALEGSFDACLIELQDFEFGDAGSIVMKVAPLLKPGAKILVSLSNRFTSLDGNGLGSLLASLTAGIQWERDDAVATVVLPTGEHRQRVHRAIGELGRTIRSRPLFGMFVLAAISLPLFGASWLTNLGTKREARKPVSGPISSLLVVIESDAIRQRTASRYRPARRAADVLAQRLRRRA